MLKKIGSLKIQTYSLSKCNLKACESIIVYPLPMQTDICPVCGGTMREYTFATQISKSDCVKLKGVFCYKCNAFFTQQNELIDWLKIKKYNKGVPNINDAYNIKYGHSKYEKIFKNTAVFRQYTLLSEKDIVTISVTYDINYVNEEKSIFYYSHCLANTLLIAEQNRDSIVTIDGNRYVIIKTRKRKIQDEEIEYKIFHSVENKVLFLGGLPSFSSNTTLFIYRGNIDCHSYHHMTEVRVIIENLSRETGFYAEYCHECGQYLMKYADYQSYLKDYKLFPCKIHFYDNYSKSDYLGRAECSPLMLNGYTVGERKNLSKTERERILAYIVDHGIMTKRKVLDYLETFILENSCKERLRIAVAKWESDKEFLLNYSEQDVPRINIGKVKKR